MTRASILLFLIAAVAVVVLAMTGDPGRASLVWLGWRIDMTAAAAVLIVLLAALLATVFWRIALWVIEIPRRNARKKAENRRRQGNEALTRGFLAAAAGDGSEARRLAQKAAELVEETPALVRVLAAQAAEAAGDLPAAKAAYNAMLGFPDMRLAGHKGLMQTALADNDRAEAVRHAQAAYGLTKTARWAWRALLEARLEEGDWSAALDLVQSALERKIVSPIVAERARAALLAASAASLETSADPRERAQALEFAAQSAKLKPGFAPGVVMAARLLQADGKTAKASALIEGAWKEAPHPALWLAYRDLKTNETKKDRARRLQALAALNPGARESRILSVEQALIAGEAAQARLAADALTQEPPTARLCGLMARLAYALGQADEARAWMVRAVGAPQEADWSDLDPEGQAFAYAPADWARLVSTYAETGELIHPRFERRERVMTELPELPVSYEDSARFVSAEEIGADLLLIPDDPGPYGDALQAAAPPEPEPPPARRATGARRRLASGPRAAK